MTLYYPQFPKGGIPPEQHPAVIEDMELYADVQIATTNRKKSWKQGELALTIVRYLCFSGPSLVSEIAEDLDSKAQSITQVLKNNPQLFKPLPIKRLMFGKNGHSAGRATVWTINTEVTN
jgi:hypothetical protein